MDKAWPWYMNVQWICMLYRGWDLSECGWDLAEWVRSSDCQCRSLQQSCFRSQHPPVDCIGVGSSVADPGFLSRIPDPDFYPSRIPDPGSRISDPGSRIPDPKNRNKREGWKKMCCQTFFFSHKFHKIVNYFIFEMLKKKMWANVQRIIGLFPKKLSLSSQKYGFGIHDPRSGIRKTYSGSRIQGSKRYRIPDPDPHHWLAD